MPLGGVYPVVSLGLDVGVTRVQEDTKCVNGEAAEKSYYPHRQLEVNRKGCLS